jgi:hypothetical protein
MALSGSNEDDDEEEASKVDDLGLLSPARVDVLSWRVGVVGTLRWGVGPGCDVPESVGLVVDGVGVIDGVGAIDEVGAIDDVGAINDVGATEVAGF